MYMYIYIYTYQKTYKNNENLGERGVTWVGLQFRLPVCAQQNAQIIIANPGARPGLPLLRA